MGIEIPLVTLGIISLGNVFILALFAAKVSRFYLAGVTLNNL